MESTKISKIINLDLKDIRQSPKWGEYLKILGWKKHSLGENKNFYSLKAGPIKLAKMQRPLPLTVSDIKNLNDICKIEEISLIKLEPNINQDLKILEDFGFVDSQSPLCPPKTTIINLKENQDTLYKKLSKSVKYSINRAKREGGRIEFLTSPSEKEVKDCYFLLSETAKNKKFVIPSIDNLIDILNIWKDEFLMVKAKDAKDQTQAIKIYLAYNNNVWYMYGGTSQAARKTKIGYLLMWESILNLKNFGYNILDLEGVWDKRFPSFTKSWGGFSHFKERFGGTQLEYPAPKVKHYNKIIKMISKIQPTAIGF